MWISNLTSEAPLNVVSLRNYVLKLFTNPSNTIALNTMMPDFNTDLLSMLNANNLYAPSDSAPLSRKGALKAIDIINQFLGTKTYYEATRVDENRLFNSCVNGLSFSNALRDLIYVKIYIHITGFSIPIVSGSLTGSMISHSADFGVNYENNPNDSYFNDVIRITWYPFKGDINSNLIINEFYRTWTVNAKYDFRTVPYCTSAYPVMSMRHPKNRYAQSTAGLNQPPSPQSSINVRIGALCGSHNFETVTDYAPTETRTIRFMYNGARENNIATSLRRRLYQRFVIQPKIIMSGAIKWFFETVDSLDSIPLIYDDDTICSSSTDFKTWNGTLL